MRNTFASLLTASTAMFCIGCESYIQIGGKVVSSSSGDPIPNAMVSLEYDPAVYPDQEAEVRVTTEEGEFWVGGTLQGRGKTSTAALRVSAPGYQPVERRYPIGEIYGEVTIVLMPDEKLGQAP
jgi:hypothetical protein